jgi:predicted MFS family arabinose efflux permease
VFVPFAAGYYAGYVFRAINALLGPQIAAEFGMGAALLGFLTSVFFLAIALSLVPLGILLDRYGPRRVDAALLLVAFVGACIYGAAGSVGMLVAGRALIGLGAAVTLMASFQAFVLWYPPERIATVNSRAFAVGILGFITVSVPLEAALRVTSWRVAVFAFAFVALVAAAAIYFVVPERREKPARTGVGVAGIGTVLADAAFRRVVAMASTGQAAMVSLSTLWMTTWLRDVAGYDRAAVAEALLVVSVAMIAGFLFFGRLADARARRSAAIAPLIAAGIAMSSACLALLALGVTKGALALWAAFTFFASAATLGYSIVSRRFPKGLAGRVNTTLNTFVFSAMFLVQWLVGLILELWPRGDAGYSPEAYGWALGVVWLTQLAGMAWFWRGRRLLA